VPAIDMVRMPPEISRGFVCSMDFGTSIVRLQGGRVDEASRTREMPMRYWHAVKGTFKRERIEEFAGFIQARAGAFHPFRFWDPSDCSTNSNDRAGAPSIVDQFLGYGDGVKTTFDLRRVYKSTTTDLPQRRAVEDRMLPIHNETDDRLAACLGLPAGTIFLARFAANAVEITDGFSINYRKRQVIFNTPPALDSLVTWGCYYDWPVRLGEDADANFETIAESWTAKSAPNIPLELVPLAKFAPETDDPGGAKVMAWASGSPLITKGEAKNWRLTANASSLSVTLEEPSIFNAGGPHFVLHNAGATNAFDVLDELTGSTILSIPIGKTAWMMVEDTGSARNWWYVLT
jgi:hypothetical protein